MRRLPLPRDPRWRFAALAALVVVALNVLGLVWSALSPEPSGPPSSSYATQPAGAAAWAALLEREGRRVVRRRDTFAEAPLDPAGTLVVLEPGPLGSDERAALARFVRAGGRLVAGGRGTEGIAADLLARGPDRAPDGPRAFTPVTPLPEAVGRVVTAGTATWRRGGDALPVLGADGGTLLLSAPAGRGLLLLLADASPVQNRLLARGDNAGLALALAPPGRPVAFAESVHGYGRATGLAALPGRWKALLVGLALAALVLVLARARRFGPPEQAERPLPPPRRVYVDAVARALARAKDPLAAAAPVTAEARRIVRHRGALPEDATMHDVRTTAEGLGLSPDEARVVAEGPARREDVLAAGRALARLRDRDGTVR